MNEVFIKAQKLKYSLYVRLLYCAKKGDSEAQYRLGRFYYNEEDYDEAEVWWEKAARNRHENAKRALLRLYRYELKHKYDNASTRVSYAEAKGRGVRNFYDPTASGVCGYPVYSDEYSNVHVSWE